MLVSAGATLWGGRRSAARFLVHDAPRRDCVNRPRPLPRGSRTRVAGTKKRSRARAVLLRARRRTAARDATPVAPQIYTNPSLRQRAPATVRQASRTDRHDLLATRGAARPRRSALADRPVIPRTCKPWLHRPGPFPRNAPRRPGPRPAARHVARQFQYSPRFHPSRGTALGDIPFALAAFDDSASHHPFACTAQRTHRPAHPTHRTGAVSAGTTPTEVRLRTIIDSALDAVVTTDADSVITGWSAHAESMFGWSADEALGRTLAETIIPERHREAHQAGVRRYLATGKGPSSASASRSPPCAGTGASFRWSSPWPRRAGRARCSSAPLSAT